MQHLLSRMINHPNFSSSNTKNGQSSKEQKDDSLFNQNQNQNSQRRHYTNRPHQRQKQTNNNNYILLDGTEKTAQKIEQEAIRAYLTQNVTPVLNKMMVKIVNEKPKNIIEFIIEFLRKQEQKYQPRRFENQSKLHINQTQNDKAFEETVATMFIKFKK